MYVSGRHAEIMIHEIAILGALWVHNVQSRPRKAIDLELMILHSLPYKLTLFKIAIIRVKLKINILADMFNIQALWGDLSRKDFLF